MRRGGLRDAVIIAVFAALLALPAPAGAVLSGINGRIVLASGRGEASDSTARLFLRPAFGSVGAGTAGPTVTPTPPAPAGVQHRHPTWSPDRTMIAYARGDANCNPTATTNCAIYILDLTDPNATPQAITGEDAVADDRPAWSPDGTRIAYETELTNGSNQTDIRVDQVPFGSPDLNLTDTTTAGQYEGKPAWTPNSQEIYYHTGDPNGTNTMDIVKEPSGGGAVTNIATNPLASEFQPSISPDGAQMCFTRGEGFNGSADVIVSLANGGGQTDLSDNLDPMAPPFDPQYGDYNCTWSPDGTLITYVQGTFSNGDLVMERSDDSGGFLTLETTMDRFDGNPDWAPDGRPECEDTAVATGLNTPVTIPLSCADTGPEYERTSIIVDVPSDARPMRGTVGEVQQGEPARVTYTPNNGFAGTDSFQIRVRDEVAFGGRATVTVNVRAPRTISFDASKGKKKAKKVGKRPLLAVKKGKKARFSGDVSAPQNVACESNQTVNLQRRKPSQASFTTFDQVQTNTSGAFSAKKKIKKTFVYRASVAESQTCEDADSGTEKVKAKKKK